MNDARDDTVKGGSGQRGRRKSAAWKSGLVLTGLGAVVLGAGYLAGVNAPAVAQGNTAATPQSVARANGQTEGVRSRESDERFGMAPNGIRLDDDQILVFDDQGNPVILANKGRPEFEDDDEDSANQLSQQFGGRRDRQFGGFSQQAPNFSGPVGRSRGS